MHWPNLAGPCAAEARVLQYRRVPKRSRVFRMKLSVVIITYNQERFVERAIKSALAQRAEFDYEIVIGDDCSTDRTPEIVRDFHRCYTDRIVPFFREQNLGANRNLEATLAACRGEYVALLEGDDYWTSEEKLQRQVDFLDAHPDCAISCHRVHVADEMGTGQRALFPLCPAGLYTIEDLLAGNFIMTVSTVFRRSLAGVLPDWFFELKLGDWPLCALIARYGKIHLMDDAMAVYRIHSGGVWSGRTTASRLLETSRMLVSLDRMLEFRYTKNIRQTLAKFDYELAILSRRENKRVDTVNHVLKCLRNGGWRSPLTGRALAGFATYLLIGQRYRVFSRAN
jgi:glycosyltransferase involved in cell wall biosynthesis